MVEDIGHRDALLELLQFDRSLPELRDLIRRFPYDYEGDAVVLTRRHVAHALQRLIDGAISPVDLEAWAELVEGRPGVQYEYGREESVGEALFQLSTPEINESITSDLCWRLLKALR